MVSYSGYFTTSVPGHQQCFGCAVRAGVGGLGGCRIGGESVGGTGRGDPSATLPALGETGISQGCFGERRAERITLNH